MSKASIPEALRTQLKEHGYSDEMIKELWKWYDSSEKKGVASQSVAADAGGGEDAG